MRRPSRRRAEHVRDHGRPRCCSRRRCPPTTPTSFGHVDDDRQEEGDGRHRRAPLRQLPTSRWSPTRSTRIKNLCYRYAIAVAASPCRSTTSRRPKAKRELLDDYEAQADKVENQFRRGIITDGERRQQEVRIWTDATAEVQEAMEAEFKAQRFNPIDMMVGSGARGNMTQMRQIAGMRGLVANPRGDMIPRPIK